VFIYIQMNQEPNLINGCKEKSMKDPENKYTKFIMMIVEYFRFCPLLQWKKEVFCKTNSDCFQLVLFVVTV